jgi:N-acetylglucosamine-6-phosphate deacetylase
MASTNPARALGCTDGLGTLRPGARATMTLLDTDLHAMAVVIDDLALPQSCGAITPL